MWRRVRGREERSAELLRGVHGGKEQPGAATCALLSGRWGVVGRCARVAALPDALAPRVQSLHAPERRRTGASPIPQTLP